MREKESNQKVLQHIEDEPSYVLYGQAVQLQHIRSGRFVTAVRQAADMSRDCLKLQLSKQGSTYSYFRIKPRFRIRSEGGRIYFTDQLI
jgi:inositol 1,4,5-triphosphate receptor type 1